jgi:hypothetical protein
MSNKFSTWLDRKPGRSMELSKALGIGRSTPSNVKHERRPVPTKWIPLLVDMSGGELTYEGLTRWRIKVSKRISKAAREREKAAS